MLQIYDPRERTLVAAADALLAAGAAVARPLRRRRKPRAPERILLLRLERIGDLLMALPGIATVRQLAPDARIDLVVGSWNEELARAIPAVDTVETLDAGWLARDNGGSSVGALFQRAAAWRRRRYDLAINFEPDIRSNLLLALTRSAWTAGYRSAGGGAVLDDAIEYDPTAHTSDNARRLAAHAFDTAAPEPAGPLLVLSEDHERRARLLIGDNNVPKGPLVAMHVSGGREVKQWDPRRFAEVARALAARHGATILLTGSKADRPLVESVKRSLPEGTLIDAANGPELLTLAALLRESDLLITGDTGPMHLAQAVGTPIVAVFGPSDPRRYAPRGPFDRVIRVDLPCAPCNRIRLPPARCRGKIPDCLALVTSDRVFDAATDILAKTANRSWRAAATERQRVPFDFAQGNPEQGRGMKAAMRSASLDDARDALNDSRRAGDPADK